ncbi:MAG TPA: metallophosphoesterase family protein [Usitatibacteraceae bacterium]
MALYGILGDIHGNQEALDAVLAYFDRRNINKILCVGDIVGYNADSDGCAMQLRTRSALAIAGNHDLIAIDRLGFNFCSNAVIHSLKRTRKEITPETARYLASLPEHLLAENSLLLVHGGVRDVQQYMNAPSQIRQNNAYLQADFPAVRICMYGHAHEQKIFEIDGEEVRQLSHAEQMSLRKDRVYFINPGSVDAARKRGYKLAECALFDSDSASIEFHRLRYLDELSEMKAKAGGYRIGPWTNRYYSLRRKISRLTGP